MEHLSLEDANPPRGGNTPISGGMIPGNMQSQMTIQQQQQQQQQQQLSSSSLGGGAGGGGMMTPLPLPPQQNQQLPPQMFTTAAQLLDLTDKKLMVALRDGRKLIGVLRSWDQFANLVLQSTIERTFVHPSTTGTQQAGLYADVPRGIYLVRGENVLLLGEIDLDKDDDAPPGYERAEPDVVMRLAKERKAKEGRRERSRLAKLREEGFEGENAGEALI